MVLANEWDKLQFLSDLRSLLPIINSKSNVI